MTAEEIAGVSIFAGLGPDECEQLARVAADIRLVPGEYAVHERDDRALFVVMEGRLETVSLVDGIERSSAAVMWANSWGGPDRPRDGVSLRVSRRRADPGDQDRGARLPRAVASRPMSG